MGVSEKTEIVNIRVRRGLEKDLPILEEGELGFTTDTKKYFIGSNEGNIELTKQEDIEVITSELAQKFDDVNAQMAQKASQTDLMKNVNELSVRQPVRYGKIKLPSDFIPVDFELYRKPDGKVYHNIDLDKRYRNKNIQRTIYTSIAIGDNVTGDGSEAKPYRTPNKAFEVAAAASETNIKIVVDADELLRNEFFLAIDTYVRFTNKHIVVTTKDNKVIPMMNADSTARPSYRIDGPINAALPAWTLTSGKVYQTTRSNTAFVVDTNYRDVFTGKIKKMLKASSLTDCQNTAGSYFIDGPTVYVHTFDDRPADNKLNCVLSWVSPYRTFQLINSTLFIENFEFFNYDGVTMRGDTSSHIIVNNCDFGETATNNSFSLLHSGKTYLLNCTTHDSFLDGFNYHYPSGVDNKNCFVFEYNCFGYNNGNEPNGTGNNCTTMHDGASILRVNTFGEESQGVLCADVGGSYSVLIDCKMMNSKLDSSNLRSASYQFTTDSATLRKAKAVLINCSGVSPNWSILTDEQKGTVLILESWNEGLDKVKRDVAL